MTAAPSADIPLGIYIHWPFCLSKCPYCDFNSHVRERVVEARWARALGAELEREASRLKGRAVGTIFFGGGTPSLMPPETVAFLIGRVRALWPAREPVEITLEANPNSVEAKRFAALAQAGVNRLSLGIQSLNDTALRFLGRRHDATEARRAIAIAAKYFPRFSFDLIYARPGQSVPDWRAELEEALALAGEHLSLYQLTIEPNTAFATAYRRGDFQLPAEEDAAQLYEATQSRLEAVGLPAYEISNHARPGSECRHNLIYWRYQDFAGIGPGAHGRLTLGEGTPQRVSTRALRAPETWIEAVERKGSGLEAEEGIDPEAALTEAILMGLRLGEGIDLGELEARLGTPAACVVNPDAIFDLAELGMLERTDRRIVATPAGRQRLDAVLRRLMA
jgi:putative oxygen-independent coproporphyrinogen III oxidase